MESPLPSPTTVTAVFDIGKTNKKLVLFDEDYSTVYKFSYSPDEIVDDDGYPCENLEEISRWMIKAFGEVKQNPMFNIKVLNISACGASLVHLDENGNVITPLYNYLKPYPEDLLQQFYSAYGEREAFALETASQQMGMLNSGLQLYWLKYIKPYFFNKIRYTLHFPQYLSFLFTGQFASEITSIGCHTAMWNYKSNDYHRWMKEEGCLDLLPEILPTTSLLTKGDIKTGPGIHDSSSALVPFLFAFEKPFILLSTGTWSIGMNPHSKKHLTYEELASDGLQYMNMYGKPVKASRFFLGSEYSHQVEKLEKYFHVKCQEDLQPNSLLLSELVERNHREQKLQLEKAHQTGPWPVTTHGYWDPALFTSFEEAYHQLMLDLVSIQADSLKIAEGADEVEQIVISGGFARNDFFTRLLASFFPRKKIYTTAVPHASALGAAMVLEEKQIESDFAKRLLGLKRHRPLEHVKIDHYSWK